MWRDGDEDTPPLESRSQHSDKRLLGTEADYHVGTQQQAEVETHSLSHCAVATVYHREGVDDLHKTVHCCLYMSQSCMQSYCQQIYQNRNTCYPQSVIVTKKCT